MSVTPFDFRPTALCLGGLDPSGGAGLLRDVLTLAALGVPAMVVPVAETIQNGLACQVIQSPSISPLERLDALAPHLSGIWGLKLSMSALDTMTLDALLDRIHALNPSVCIWDPILAPSVGAVLHDPERLRAMAKRVLGTGAWVVNPNWIEASALAGKVGKPASCVEPEALARPILELGAKAVWLKGGHREGAWVEDLWIDAQGLRRLGRHRRLAGERRGTGCFLASAWLGLRLKGLDEVSAAQEASRLLRQAWHHSLLPGGVGRPMLPPEGR